MAATHVIKGVVDSTHTKTVNTRFGDKLVYHGVVDGVEFSTGFKKLTSQGEMVTLGVAWKYGNWQTEEGAVSSGLPAATVGNPSPSPSGGSGGGSGGGGRGSGTFPVDPKSGQISIIRQNSMNRAVEIMAQWQISGVFQTKSEETYLKKLLETALLITDFNSGQDIMQLAAAQLANQQAVA